MNIYEQKQQSPWLSPGETTDDLFLQYRLSRFRGRQACERLIRISTRHRQGLEMVEHRYFVGQYCDASVAIICLQDSSDTAVLYLVHIVSLNGTLGQRNWLRMEDGGWWIGGR